MPRSELPQPLRRSRSGWRALATAVVPILALGVACGSTTPGTAVDTSSPAAVTSSSASATLSSKPPVTTSSPASMTTSGTGGAGFDDATIASFQQVLDDTRATAGFPGVIALVSSPQRSWIGTSGTTGEGLDAVPTPTDHTRVGSLTKTMTATVALQLAEEGAIEPERPDRKVRPRDAQRRHRDDPAAGGDDVGDRPVHHIGCLPATTVRRPVEVERPRS